MSSNSSKSPSKGGSRKEGLFKGLARIRDLHAASVVPLLASNPANTPADAERQAAIDFLSTISLSPPKSPSVSDASVFKLQKKNSVNINSQFKSARKPFSAGGSRPPLDPALLPVTAVIPIPGDASRRHEDGTGGGGAGAGMGTGADGSSELSTSPLSASPLPASNPLQPHPLGPSAHQHAHVSLLGVGASAGWGYGTGGGENAVPQVVPIAVVKGGAHGQQQQQQQPRRHFFRTLQENPPISIYSFIPYTPQQQEDGPVASPSLPRHSVEKSRSHAPALPSATPSYDPHFLDDPTLTEGKHRTLYSFPSLRVSFIPYVLKKEVTEEVNEKFARRHPNIVRKQQLPLTRIRKVKRLMRRSLIQSNLPTSEILEPIARAYVLLEKLIILEAVNADSRKAAAAACLMITAKLCLDACLSKRFMSFFVAGLVKNFRVPKDKIVNFEAQICARNDISLLTPSEQFKPHLEILQGLHATDMLY
ncbi:MAG: hypothetical protein Q8P67_17960 [archaeon]|nr:hypothetical protein [archaeon]